MANWGSATVRVTGMLLVILLASIALLPGRVLAGANGNISVTGSGTTITGGTTVSGGAGSVQSNVGAAQSAGGGTNLLQGPVCGSAPLAPISPGAASAGAAYVTGANGGSASSGTATGGVVIGGNAVGGNATGGNATGASVVGGNNAGGTSKQGTVPGGAAVGGSAVGGAAIGGTTSGCVTLSAPIASKAPQDSGSNALICGDVRSASGTTLTLSTLTGLVDLTIPASAQVIGTIPTSGNVCLALTRTSDQITVVLVLRCHGSTNGAVELSQLPSGVNVAPVGGSECGRLSVHSNSETVVNGGTSTAVNISLDCPDICAPDAPAVSAGNSVSPPTATATSVQATATPVVVPSHVTGSSLGSGSQQGIALQLSDLPNGFQPTEVTALDTNHRAPDAHPGLTIVQAPGHVAAFESGFRRAVAAGELSIGDRVDVYRSDAAAHASYKRTARALAASYRSHHAPAVKSAGVGNESTQYTVPSGLYATQTTTVTVLFRRGHDVAVLTIKGPFSLVTAQQTAALAHLLDARIQHSR